MTSRHPSSYLVAVALLMLVCLALPAFAKTSKNNTIVTYPSGFAVSQPVADLPVDFSMFPGQEMPEPRPSPNKQAGSGQIEDPALQKETLQPLGVGKGIDFDGIASNGYAPSDSNMAVGPNHIVETVNVEFQVFDKSGSSLAGPTSIQTLFNPLGGVCASTFGDPIVLYDRAADRWLISMIGGSGAFGECIAISKTNDPTGAYFLFAYSFGNNLNDYPKLSTWATASNSAYLATYDIFVNGQSFGGSDLCGFDRTKLLAGNSLAAQLCKMTPATEFSYLPSDMDGPTPPADGTPGIFINHHNGANNRLYLRTLALDFASGTATLSSPTAITVASYTEACHSSCVPQSGTTQKLDALGDLQMYRFPVRHFPDHDRAVLNHSVIVSGSQIGVRWYELYDPAGSVTLNQQGTYAPDSSYRWMGSVAEDQAADIAVGYSASSSSIHPAIRFAGRVPSDPSGSLESEISIIEGAGSQTSGLSRWGDYSAMQVDPSDDCTFWYVQQYEQTSGTFNWHTRIGSFAFSNCSGSPDFSLNANPNALTIAPGNQGTSTITVVPINGFNGSVTLSATGMPSGVTAGFNPNPTTTTSTMTITVPTGTASGTSTVTITGVSGSLSHNTTLQLTISGGGGTTVTLTPSSLAWGKIVVGVKSAAKAATLTNTGTSTLNISNIAASGDFAVSSTTCGATLAAGKFCKIKVTFTPTQTGTRTGTLSVTDDGQGSPQTVALSGTGTVQATLTPTSATYPARLVGTTSPAKTFTLSNKQNVALTGISIGTTGDFAVSTTTCTASLAAKTNCTIGVTFTPTGTGTRTGTLSVSDSANNSPQTSSLTGTGK